MMGKSQPNPATCLAALSLSIVYSFSHSVSRSFIDGWWRGDDTAEPIGSRQCKVRYNQIKRKAFGTFGLDRNGWDHDPLIRAVIKNRGKSFSRRTSLALWSRNLWSSFIYIYTDVANENGPFAHLCSKVLIFKRVFHNFRVLPHLCPP